MRGVARRWTGPEFAMDNGHPKKIRNETGATNWTNWQKGFVWETMIILARPMVVPVAEMAILDGKKRPVTVRRFEDVWHRDYQFVSST